MNIFDEIKRDAKYILLVSFNMFLNFEFIYFNGATSVILNTFKDKPTHKLDPKGRGRGRGKQRELEIA